MVTTPTDINDIFADILKFINSKNLKESDYALVLANLILEFAKTKVIPLDVIMDSLTTEVTNFNSYPEVFTLLNNNPSALSPIVADLGHKLIVVSHNLEDIKEDLYGQPKES